MKSASCDKEINNGVTCRKPAYVEVYWNLEHKNGEMGHWSYLCKKHYLLDRICNFLFHRGNGYAILDTEGYEDVDFEYPSKRKKATEK